jgi:ferredoxin
MFRRELCAHGASGIEGCRRCLDVCGTGAITSANLSIEIDPYLCQGCGECSTVCPSGAISYAYPGRAETLNRLWRMLDAYFDAGGRSPLVLFHDDAGGKAWVEGNAERLPEFVLPYALESLGSVGLEVWLSALALGAGRVLLLAAARPTGPAQQALVAQIGYAGEILSAMGYEATLVEMIGPDDGLDRLAEDAPALPERPRARFAAVSEKRTVLHMAVEHLHRYGRREAEFAPLSTGAPFGEVWVDGGKCTLCMACVSICPSSALADGGELPRLKFIEANCVQCGLCESACPEDAVALAPRYVYDQQEARRTRVLHEEPVFNCIECGKPFATEKMIKTITDRLQDNWMFQGEGRRRLMMCEDCRVKAMFGRPGGGA